MTQVEIKSEPSGDEIVGRYHSREELESMAREHAGQFIDRFMKKYSRKNSQQQQNIGV